MISLCGRITPYPEDRLIDKPVCQYAASFDAMMGCAGLFPKT
jgi:hypothetical protein